jgi:hypothetical protein
LSLIIILLALMAFAFVLIIFALMINSISTIGQTCYCCGKLGETHLVNDVYVCDECYDLHTEMMDKANGINAEMDCMEEMP